MRISRRIFLAGAGLFAAVSRTFAASPRQGLEAFGGSEPPCGPDAAVTPAVPADGTFRAGAPLRASVVPPGFKGETLSLSGTLSGTQCGRIKSARIDFWQPDAQGRYDTAGFTLRGHVLTDAAGHYSVTTPTPGAAAGRAPHVSIRVSIAGKPDFYTEAFLPGDARNSKDPRFRPELAMRRTAIGYLFDVTLNM